MWYGHVMRSSGLAKTILRAQCQEKDKKADRRRGEKITSANGQTCHPKQSATHDWDRWWVIERVISGAFTTTSPGVTRLMRWWLLWHNRIIIMIWPIKLLKAEMMSKRKKEKNESKIFRTILLNKRGMCGSIGNCFKWYNSNMASCMIPQFYS